MILTIAIANITSDLDVIVQKDGKGISSNSKIKEQALSCLISLLKGAPESEYHSIYVRDQLVVGYLISVLCKISKNDKSRSIRTQALEVILVVLEKAEEHHDINEDYCSLDFALSALPGVSSTLFQILMSDTKLPKNLLQLAVKNLGRIICLGFMQCLHRKEYLGETHEQEQEKKLIDNSENISIRISFLFNYIMNNSNHLPAEMMVETLNLCCNIVSIICKELVSRCLKPVIKYLAFMSSSDIFIRSHRTEIELQLITLSSYIEQNIAEFDDIEPLIIKSLFELLDKMESDCVSSLDGERESQLATLSGYIKLIPSRSLTLSLEDEHRRNQIVKILETLTEFSTEQPFLFLTNNQIDDTALETSDKIYTMERRFKHLGRKEIDIITKSCKMIGQRLDWDIVSDMVRIDLCKFHNNSNLFITSLILDGFLDRVGQSEVVSRLASQLISLYIDNIEEIYPKINSNHEIQSWQEDTLRVMLSIETIVIAIRIYLTHQEKESLKTVMLRDLICPLLNWSTSVRRGISEASLKALNEISIQYRKKSIKDLIEANMDYVVDGISKLLINFEQNADIANVLAVAIKLSSIDNLFYFKDIYIKIFKLTGTFHHTEKSKSIALLFYRTLSIMNEWKDAVSPDEAKDLVDPLNNTSTIAAIREDLSITKRLKKLARDLDESEKIRRRLDDLDKQIPALDEKRVVDDINEGKILNCDRSQENEQEEPKKVKTPEVTLVEKILSHCVGLLSSNNNDTQVLTLKAIMCGIRFLRDDEDVLLPLVHQIWTPLIKRLNNDYKENLEVNICAFDCLITMAIYSKDFIKRRTLDSILPRICLFLESQAKLSRNQKDFDPYCMTLAYKCQHGILKNLGPLVYNIQLEYTSLWRIIRVSLVYLDSSQAPSLRKVARRSLRYMIALDADCVWYFAKMGGYLHELPFDLIYE